MENDLTTGTWQDNIRCPINIILFCTSDGELEHHHGAPSFDPSQLVDDHTPAPAATTHYHLRMCDAAGFD